MAAVGSEGLPAAAAGAGRLPVPSRDGSRSTSTVEELLKQLRQEPSDDAECTAKFLLYEGYASEVEEMRGTLFKFHEESRPTLPPAIASDMDKHIKSIDS